MDQRRVVLVGLEQHGLGRRGWRRRRRQGDSPRSSRGFADADLVAQAVPRDGNGSAFQVRELQVVGRDSQPFIKLRLEDVLVSSFQMGGGSGDALPRDSIALSYAKATESVSRRKADGTLDAPVTGAFDFSINKQG